jgi:hypothetical protein
MDDMDLKARGIVAELNGFYVAQTGNSYTVFRPTATAAKADSSYPLTDDGLSIAVCRMEYLANRA